MSSSMNPTALLSEFAVTGSTEKIRRLRLRLPATCRADRTECGDGILQRHDAFRSQVARQKDVTTIQYLQLLQLIEVLLGQQVWPGGQRLSGLDDGRPQVADDA